MDTDKLIQRYASGERNFKDVSLREADLRDADLSGANLDGAELGRANLGRVDLCGADRRGSTDSSYAREEGLAPATAPAGVTVWPFVERLTGITIKR